jgi:purine-nucleoside phosphorylase
MLGPSYETPAEIEMLRVMGAGVVGMSTVPESRFARLLGLDTAALSCVTNLVPSRPSAPLSHGDVLAVLKNSGQTALRMIEAWLRDPFVRNPF